MLRIEYGQPNILKSHNIVTLLTEDTISLTYKMLCTRMHTHTKYTHGHYTHTHIHTHTRTQTRTHTHTHTHTCNHAITHARTNTHTHTHKQFKAAKSSLTTWVWKKEIEQQQGFRVFTKEMDGNRSINALAREQVKYFF